MDTTGAQHRWMLSHSLWVLPTNCARDFQSRCTRALSWWLVCVSAAGTSEANPADVSQVAQRGRDDRCNGRCAPSIDRKLRLTSF